MLAVTVLDAVCLQVVCVGVGGSEVDGGGAKVLGAGLA